MKVSRNSSDEVGEEAIGVSGTCMKDGRISSLRVGMMRRSSHPLQLPFLPATLHKQNSREHFDLNHPFDLQLNEENPKIIREEIPDSFVLDDDALQASEYSCG